MNRDKDTITYQQFFFLIIQTQLGVGVLSLPYIMHNSVHSDGWISVLLAGLLLQGVLFGYIMLFKRFKSRNILDIAGLLFGKKIGKLITLFYILYFISVGSLILVLYARVVDRWILPNTPNWVICALLVVAGIYLSVDGLKILARFYTLVTPLVILLVLLVSYTLKDANIYYIFPIGQAGVKNIVIGSKDAILSMLGFEIILLTFPMVSGTNRQKFKAVSYANLFITLLYTYLVVVSFIYFSPEEIKILPEPLLYILKSYTFKIIERTDLLFLSLWIFLVFTSFGSYLFLAAETGTKLFNNKKHRRLVYYFAFIIFGISFLPEFDIQFIDYMSSYIPKTSFIFILFPAFMLIVSFLFKKSEQGCEANDPNS
ncbi:GerAB/ArcD/ProY family transporter [Mesobacillus jeotgali]|uniref:GerAB/ArcD/ProY family transporter n=1 Tax=Mesobacillus jeotgali TaxID=129985 RepID=UPI00178404F5|nr:GerAB/ArcD/ProY family transporter [Mesobacillus jeotgali]UYZ21272.1 spore germination protein [Mesobacillus jeotgali]